jgi:hypothetical protein
MSEPMGERGRIARPEATTERKRRREAEVSQANGVSARRLRDRQQ